MRPGSQPFCCNRSVDKAFDTNWLLADLDARGAMAVIPPKANWKIKRAYDKALLVKSTNRFSRKKIIRCTAPRLFPGVASNPFRQLWKLTWAVLRHSSCVWKELAIPQIRLVVLLYFDLIDIDPQSGAVNQSPNRTCGDRDSDA